MTNDQILSNHEYDVHYYGGGRRHVLEAMDLFAKQQAIAFAEWMEKMDCHKVTAAGKLPPTIYYIGIYYTTPEKNKLYTIGELHTIFEQSQTNNNDDSNLYWL